MSRPRPATPTGSDVVAVATSERGDVVLRRRATDGALELRVNGVFVMDDRETATERLLARLTLEALAVAPTDIPGAPGVVAGPEGWRVLVGGLGLGFTLAAVLDSPRVASVTVAEIEGAVVDWHRAGLVVGSGLDDERVTVAVADVREVVGGLPPAALDLVLLDVDNGPGFLVYDDNAAVYGSPFLTSCRQVLAPGGLLAVWSADHAPDLVDALDAVFGSTVEHALPVTLGTRHTTYHLFLAPSPR